MVSEISARAGLCLCANGFSPLIGWKTSCEGHILANGDCEREREREREGTEREREREGKTDRER